ncbi:MAG: right-handed parallel beta-helix repeat-containing protein [Anaerolineaceae bacterium]|jgi:hypothetical protein|nr:MAG: right-handed parallel beta-helix repeat-containing protein [Anaerolineaceae bacterium]
MKFKLPVKLGIAFAQFFLLTGMIVPSRVLPSDNPAFAQISLYPNIETAGVVVSGTGLPKKAELMYRQSGDPNWRVGHPLMRIDDGRLVGSLFGLSPSTTYEVKVIDGVNEISSTLTTQPDELLFTPSTVIYVNDDAPPGGDGSFATPFQTIQEGVNRAAPGTQVLVADGIYRESISFPASGSPNGWIQVKAEGGGAILDSSESLAPEVWIPHPNKPHVWFTKIGPAIKYLGRDQNRFYMYNDLAGLLSERGHSNVLVREGWYYEPSTTRLYVRSLDDPARHAWQVPRLNHTFDVQGRDWIWIEGFEMRFYGADANGCGVCTVNASHVVIRKNKIHNMQLGIFVNWTGGEDRGNDTRIEYNEIYDPPVNEWEWKSVKGSSMEGTAIVLRGHIGAILRGNNLHHFFNGIYTGSSAALENPGVAFDADIYNNRIHHISDDGLEPEGASINQRFRNNTIDQMLVGISIAPITQGPAWVMRSTFSNFTGTSIKWDLNSDGIVLIYHNTSWTNASGLNAMSMIRPVHNAVMRNNIFQGNGYAFEEPFTGSTGHDWNYDNWHTTRASPHFKWENIEYSDISELCRKTGLECNGHESPPAMSNPGGGDFTLLPSSPNVDRGALIPGINDNFAGSAPDIGAFESGYGAPPPPATDTPTPQPTAPPIVTSILRADSSPTIADIVRFTVTFSKNVSGVDTGDFILRSTDSIAGAAIAEINGAGNVYTVLVHTGSGSGTLRLDLIDNDSIMDEMSVPLGGVGVGNGDFVTGETYTVDKTAPYVTSVLRADPSPTSAGSVRFVVGFSELVSGVDPADFLLAVSGVNEAVVTNVSGMGNLYTVTVSTGSGNGIIRLDVTDNDSIVDGSSLPLGGVGFGNGNFNAGEIYTIDRFTPAIVTETFASVGTHDGWVLESREDSGRGGSMNSKAATFRLGDNAQDAQYRAILHFATESLPDNAVITQAILTIQLQGMAGTDPFKTHRNISIDIRQGVFGSFGPFAIGALQVSDFQAPASKYLAGTIQNNPVGGWYWTMLDSAALPFINTKGATQLRLYFQLDDNDDRGEDYLAFFSGSYGVPSARPQLQAQYYIPR